MAGTIDSLDFKVILDDKDFNATVQRDLKIARELNTQLTNVLNLKKKLNGETTQQLVNAEKVRQAEQKTAQEIAKTALQQEKVRTQTEKTAAAQRSHTGAVQGTNTALLNTTSIMRTLSMLTGATFSVIGIRRFLSSLIDITGQFEVQKMALRTMLKDVSAADRIFRQLYDFSSESTYRFSELAKYAKQLSGFQIGKDDLLETTKMLGDVASGLGISMDRLILAYGHVKSSGFLRGIQLRSFSQNGVPILKELSDMFTEIEGKAVSMGDVFDKMTKREISFDMVAEAFRRMTSEGGQFYQMQEVLSKTLAGQINILKGKWENALYAIGQSNDGILKDGVKALRFIVEHLQELGMVLKPVIAGFGAYYAALLLAALGQKALALGRFISEFVVMAKNVGIASAAVTAFGSTAKAAAVGVGILGAAIVVVMQLVKATGAANKEMEKFRRELDKIHEESRENNSIDAEVSKIDSLRKVLNDTNNSYEARKEALRQLKSIVPGYHADLTEEGRLINNNTVAVDKYVEALNREAKMKGAQDEIAELYKVRRKIQRDLDEQRKLQKSNYDFTTVGTSTTGYTFSPGTELNSQLLVDISVNEQKIKDVDRQIESINKEIADTIGTLGDGVESYDVKSIVESIKKYDKDIEELRKKAKKGVITAEEKETLDTYRKARAEEAQLYEDIMGIKYDKDNPSTTSKTNLFSDRISDAKTDISILEKYRAAYEQLEPWLGEDAAKKWVEKNMGYDIDKFEDDVKTIIASLRKMGDEGNEAADVIEARLGLDAVSIIVRTAKELDKQKKAIEKVENELDKWKKEWGGNYSGFDGDLEKVFNKYINENKKIDKEYTDALKEAAIVYKDDEVALKKYTDELERYYKVRKDANFNKSQNDINELASKYVKDATKGMSLSDWGDKSLSQVYTIWKTLDSMADSALDGGMTIDNNLVQQVEKAGFSLKDFSKLTYEEFQKLGKEAQEELLKKVGGAIKDIASTCKDAASSVQEFADAAGNMNLSATIEDLSNFVDLASSVAERVARGDIVGAATSMVSWYVKRIFEAKTEAMKLEAALASVREEARRTQMESALSFGTDGIFGKNSLQGVSNSLSLIRDLEKSMGKYASEVSSKRFFGSRLGFFEWASEPNQKFHYTNLQKMAEAVGGDLYDAYGNLNADTLQDILDTYENLDAEQRAWIEHAISDSTAYAKALEQIDQVAESIVGGLVSDVADKMVDSWWEAGEAALDYADILGDVAKAYAKLIVQDMLMDAAFDEGRQKEFKEALRSGDASKAMAVVEQAMASAESMLPAVNAALQAFEPYRVAAQDALDSSSNSVGSGIKSITEETANLLASYINAIRADVSYIRLMQEKGWSSVNALGAFVPDLNDYLAQVAATNYDIAQSNQAILAELRTVIGAPGTSGSVVRVERYN